MYLERTMRFHSGKCGAPAGPRRTAPRALFVITCAAAVLAVPASASGAVIGSDLGDPAAGVSCPAGCVVVQERIGGEWVEVAPPRAVITGWSTRGAVGVMALRVYRHDPAVE